MAMKTKRQYFGEFNQNGYEIFLAGARDQDPVYQAGNCKYDSSQYLPPNSGGAIDIVTIEEYCIQTGKEIAEEYGGTWIGCVRVDDYEPYGDADDYDADKTVGFDPDICGD